MSFSIELDEKAETEFAEATSWYHKESEALAIRFINLIQISLEKIARNPLAYPNKKYSHREFVVDDFPYVIVYKVFNSKKKIYVLRVFHTSRNPKRKHSR